MAKFESSFTVPDDLTEVTDLQALRDRVVLAWAELKEQPATPDVLAARKAYTEAVKAIKVEDERRTQLAADNAAVTEEFETLTAKPAAPVEAPKAETPAAEKAEEPTPAEPAPAAPAEPAAPEAAIQTPALVTEPAPVAPVAVETPTPAAEPVAPAAVATEPVTEREPVAASMSDMGGQTRPPATTAARQAIMYAAGDATQHGINSELTMQTFADELIAVSASMANGSGSKNLATIKREFTSDFIVPSNVSDVTEIARYAGDAAAGRVGVDYAVTCAPPQQLETICNRVDPNEGIATFPTIGLTRETITWRRGLDWCDDVFGTGYGTWTDGMRADPDAVKVCADVTCRDGGECTALPDWFCVDTDIMLYRFDRPAVEDFMEKLVARYNRWRNRKRLNDLTAIALATTGGLPLILPAKFGMVARLADAFLLAATDIRMREGMSRTAPMRIYAPWETPEMMMAAEGYRDDIATLRLAMSEVESLVAKHGVTVEWVHDLQPALGSPGDSPGEEPAVCDAAPALDWPDSLRFIITPTGAVVSAEADIININTVYDSPSLARNKFKLRFGEDTYCMIDLCPGSRVYEVPVCVNGTVGGRAATTDVYDCP